MIEALLVLQLALAPLSAVAPPSPSDPGWLHAAVAGSIIAHAADISTTMYCRGARTCSEANPALRWLQDQPIAFAAAKMTVAVGMNYALLRLHKRHPKLTLALALAQVGGYGYISYRNAQTLPDRD